VNAFYVLIRSIQDSCPPIRSKFVAIAVYAVLVPAAAWVLPSVGRHVDVIWHRSGALMFPLLGALYGHCKWAIAVDRYWWRPHRTYDGEQEQGR